MPFNFFSFFTAPWMLWTSIWQYHVSHGHLQARCFPRRSKPCGKPPSKIKNSFHESRALECIFFWTKKTDQCQIKLTVTGIRTYFYLDFSWTPRYFFNFYKQLEWNFVTGINVTTTFVKPPKSSKTLPKYKNSLEQVSLIAGLGKTINRDSESTFFLRTLDVPTCQGNDWRKLATALGADHYVSYLSAQQSPSEALLNLWETKTTDPEPLRALSILLREINREDAIIILERDLKWFVAIDIQSDLFLMSLN